MPEKAAHRIKRLQMRSMRRGIKEMDLILGGFAQTGLVRLSDEALTLYDQMLNENDHDLYQWVTGQAATPPSYTDLISRIQAGLPKG